MIKKNIGISNEGKRLSVLQSFIFKMERPELTIKTPPTIDISSINALEKKDADR